MGLFKPAWMIAEKDVHNTKKWQAAYEYIRRSGAEELRLIAVKAPSRTARREAFSRMGARDLAMILGELDSDDASDVRGRIVTLALTGDQSAVSAVTDGAMSAEILKKAMDDATYGELSQKGRPGFTPLSPAQRSELLSRVSDPEALSDIARKAKNEHIRYEAAMKAGDEKALGKIALEAKEHTVQFNAAAGIRDPLVRMELLSSPDASPDTRRGALSGFSEETLAGIVLRDDLPEGSRSAAVAALSAMPGSRVSLEPFITDETMPLAVKLEAVKTVKDTALLERIARSGGAFELRSLALENITDHNVLARIRDEVPELREAACGRMGHDMVFAGTEKTGSGTVSVSRCRICGWESRVLNG